MKFTCIYSENEVRAKIESVLSSINGESNSCTAIAKLTWAIEQIEQCTELNKAEQHKLNTLVHMKSSLVLAESYSLPIESVEISE